MNCIDCLEAAGKDFENLDENNCCPQCEKTLCPYCEDHMYDAKEERMCAYCDEDRCQVCVDSDFENLDENNCCHQCKKTLCPYCEDHMYDAKEERMCDYCDEERCKVCTDYIKEKAFMACVDTVCHERQNITLKTVFNMFLWLVLNHKNFEHHHMYDCEKKLAKTEAVENLCYCF